MTEATTPQWNYDELLEEGHHGLDLKIALGARKRLLLLTSKANSGLVDTATGFRLDNGKDQSGLGYFILSSPVELAYGPEPLYEPSSLKHVCRHAIVLAKYRSTVSWGEHWYIEQVVQRHFLARSECRTAYSVPFGNYMQSMRSLLVATGRGCLHQHSISKRDFAVVHAVNFDLGMVFQRSKLHAWVDETVMEVSHE